MPRGGSVFTAGRVLSFGHSERMLGISGLLIFVAVEILHFVQNDTWVTDILLPPLALPLGELASHASLRGHTGGQ